MFYLQIVSLSIMYSIVLYFQLLSSYLLLFFCNLQAELDLILVKLRERIDSKKKKMSNIKS